jgi:uncharacterized membrane protein YhaH (DUF805 family)
MEWMLMPLRRYADFSGRSRRKEYWMFTLLLLILYAVIATIAVVTGSLDSAAGLGFSMFGGISLFLLAVVGLAMIIPSIAVQVRRFHDQDRSGWFVLLNFIPYLGGFIVLVMMCLEGTKGPNRFGDDPKGAAAGDVFS